MGFGRDVFEFLKQGSIAHAKWDMEMSLSIVQSRKKLLILALLVLPILLINFAFASDIIGSKTWRLTAPLRFAIKLLRAFQKKLG